MSVNKEIIEPVINEEKDYAWKDEQEQILKKWADKALCLKMMHERANRKYWCLNAWFNIPVIVIATLTGTGNFASGSMGSNTNTFIFVLGSLNIIAGILATIASYTGVAQRLEELAISRIDRVNAKDFIKQISDEYDRLMEMSPMVPNDIIRWFSNMIHTGQFEEQLSGCGLFCFERICFPCGCKYCNILSCQCSDTIPILSETEAEIKASWKNIELPEIIGRIRPTEIAIEPPIINVDVNPYDIYKQNINQNDSNV